jgi:hypothetical protein
VCVFFCCICLSVECENCVRRNLDPGQICLVVTTNSNDDDPELLRIDDDVALSGACCGAKMPVNLFVAF